MHVLRISSSTVAVSPPRAQAPVPQLQELSPQALRQAREGPVQSQTFAKEDVGIASPSAAQQGDGAEVSEE